MKILNMGSLNNDYVYTVDHMVREGETLAASKREQFCGGKGLNQSIALAKAGVPVFHAGLVGEDGDFLLDACKSNGIDTTYMKKVAGESGHTIIQVDKNAQNCILLYGGSNRKFTKEYIDEVLDDFGTGDILLLQNEINMIDYIVDRAYEKGMTIVLNPSPYDENLDAVDMRKISIFLMNEIEAEQITGSSDSTEVLNRMKERYPDAKVILTLGDKGSIYQGDKEIVHQDIVKVKAVDTTAAGDTFTGYFLAGLYEEKTVEQIMKECAAASAIAVSREGASASIPDKEEVSRFLEESF